MFVVCVSFVSFIRRPRRFLCVFFSWAGLNGTTGTAHIYTRQDRTHIHTHILFHHQKIMKIEIYTIYTHKYRQPASGKREREKRCTRLAVIPDNMEERLGGRKKVGRWPLMWVTTSFFFYYYFQLFFFLSDRHSKGERKQDTRTRTFINAQKFGNSGTKISNRKKRQIPECCCQCFFFFSFRRKEIRISYICFPHTHSR